MKIITNNVGRYSVDASELTAKERADWDMLDWAAFEAGNDSAEFLRYKGSTYILSDFQTTRSVGAPECLKAWDGYLSDSFFSGIVIRYDHDSEAYVVGTFIL